MPFNSLPGKISYPAYSTLTKFNLPELSFLLAPPISAFEPSTTLSHSAVPLTSFEHLLIGAWPRITKPPHRPLSNSPTVPSIAVLCVNLIGFDCVPLAMIFEPLLTTR